RDRLVVRAQDGPHTRGPADAVPDAGIVIKSFHLGEQIAGKQRLEADAPTPSGAVSDLDEREERRNLAPGQAPAHPALAVPLGLDGVPAGRHRAISASPLDLRGDLSLCDPAGGAQDIAEDALIVGAPREVVPDHRKHATPIPDDPLSPVAHDREALIVPRIHIRAIDTPQLAQRPESPLNAK